MGDIRIQRHCGLRNPRSNLVGERRRRLAEATSGFEVSAGASCEQTWRRAALLGPLLRQSWLAWEAERMGRDGEA